MTKAVFVGDITENNGKTIKENNLEREHQFPINTLVDITFEESFDNEAYQKVEARVYVYSHGRDCDGTPLYTLSKKRNIGRDPNKEIFPGVKFNEVNPIVQDYFEGIFAEGISEESLQYVRNKK